MSEALTAAAEQAKKPWYQREPNAWIATALAVLAFGMSFWEFYQDNLRVSNDLTLSPISFDESYAVNPTRVGFVMTNAGNRPAVLISAYLGFHNPGHTIKLRDGRTASSALVVEQTWPEEEKKANSLPRTFDAGETDVLYLRLPRPIDAAARRRLVVVTHATNAHRQQFVAETIVGEVGAPTPTGDRYQQLRSLRSFTLPLLQSRSVSRDK